MLVNNPSLENLETKIIHPDDQQAGQPGVAYEVDVLTQFKANLAQLEDLQLRLKFVLNEVSDLLKKR